MNKTLKNVLKALLIILLLLILLAAGVLGYLSVKEYKPADHEDIPVQGVSAENAVLRREESIRMVTWNIGYGALGDNADFFMDGGTHVYTANKTRVQENMDNILAFLTEGDYDIVHLQEVDLNSSRSWHINETGMLMQAFPLHEGTFAYNFNSLYVPFPIPPIGHVESGLVTLSAYPVSVAERLQLPVPFSWPIRIANLKRCLLVERIKVEGTDKELVLCNLHLEAYDDGEGKEEQTRKLFELLTAEREKGNYVIAAGDFNQIFSNIGNPFASYEGIWQPGMLNAEDLPEGFDVLMDTAFPSCRSLDRVYAGADKGTFAYYVIDGFIVSDNISVSEFNTVDLDFVSSDHNPVVMEFSLK